MGRYAGRSQARNEQVSLQSISLGATWLITPVIPFRSFWVLCVAGAFDVSQTKSIVEIHLHWLWYWTVLEAWERNLYHMTIHSPLVIVLWCLAWCYNIHSTALWCYDRRGWAKDWPEVRWSGPTTNTWGDDAYGRLRCSRNLQKITELGILHPTACRIERCSELWVERQELSQCMTRSW